MASFEFGSMNSNWNPLEIAFAFLEARTNKNSIKIYNAKITDKVEEQFLNGILYLYSRLTDDSEIFDWDTKHISSFYIKNF